MLTKTRRVRLYPVSRNSVLQCDIIVFSFFIIIGESPTYILDEDTQPVIRAIGVSHTLQRGVSTKYSILKLECFFLLSNNPAPRKSVQRYV